MLDPCDKCEELMQPYLDGVLSDAEVAEAQHHLALCHWCAKRYRFEHELHMYVRTAAASEAMPAELKQKLASLRTPLF